MKVILLRDRRKQSCVGAVMAVYVVNDDYIVPQLLVTQVAVKGYVLEIRTPMPIGNEFSYCGTLEDSVMQEIEMWEE